MTTFSKGDMLILHMTEDYFTHLLVVHVLLEEKVYYCWDTKAEIYRLVYDHPRLHMLCPAFDPEFPSDVDWSNEWMFELYMRKYTLGRDPEALDASIREVDFSTTPSGSA
jgi:hypothetical protein